MSAHTAIAKRLTLNRGIEDVLHLPYVTRAPRRRSKKSKAFETVYHNVDLAINDFQPVDEHRLVKKSVPPCSKCPGQAFGVLPGVDIQSAKKEREEGSKTNREIRRMTHVPGTMYALIAHKSHQCVHDCIHVRICRDSMLDVRNGMRERKPEWWDRRIVCI